MTAPASPESPRLRLTILMIVVGCLFVALIARLWYLQVINVSSTKSLIQSTGVLTLYTPAPRGEILDREGQPLVRNISIPVIEVVRQDYSDKAMVTRLAALLDTTNQALRKSIDNVQYEYYDYVPVKENATPAQILYVEQHASEFPGVIATTVTQPHVTPLGLYAANIVGYVGPISSQQLKAWKGQGYQPGDTVGQGGAELEFEKELKGTPGKTEIEVNAQDQELSVLKVTPPKPGHDVRLSINGPLQKLAVQTLRKQEAIDRTQRAHYPSTSGAVVVEDPRNGQLLALATDPDYNPNLFNSGKLTNAEFRRMEYNPAGNELVDLATQGQYAPGSTFKLTTATAGLKAGFVTPTSPYDDKGYLQLGPTRLEDDGGVGAGVIELPQAIAVSSDAYFYQIGVDFWDARDRLGQAAMQRYETAYGFGKPTGIDLPSDAAGVIPTPAYYQMEKCEMVTTCAKTHHLAPIPNNPQFDGIWYSGDSAHTAIGQGQVLVTPLQLADAYAAFANGGTLYAPQVAIDAQDGTGLHAKVVKSYGATVKGHSPKLTPAERSAMIQGFVGVVNGSSGTATIDFASSPVAKYDIAGKTGTAQVQGKQATGVFTSFAPANKPRFVVDCFMPEAGYGADAAAPVVRTMYEKLFGTKITPQTYANASGSQG